MPAIHLLKKTEAKTRLTLLVRLSQGGKKASWAASKRPEWWGENQTVTLDNGLKVTTGQFISNSKKAWRLGEILAAIFLYEQWRASQPSNNQPETLHGASSKSKEEPRKSKPESREPTVTTFKSAKVEEEKPSEPVQRKSRRAKPTKGEKRNARAVKFDSDEDEFSPTITPAQTTPILGTKRSMTPESESSPEFPIDDTPPSPFGDRPVSGNTAPGNHSKKRRITLSSSPSDKENRAPSPVNIPSASKKETIRHARSQKKLAASNLQRMTTRLAKENRDNEQEDEDVIMDDEMEVESKRLQNQRIVKRIKEGILRFEQARDKALRATDIEADRKFSRAAKEVQMMTDKLRDAYRSNGMKMPKKIQQMPICQYMKEHNGNADAWLQKETERGVDQTLRELQEGNDRNGEAKNLQQSDAVIARRQALTKTARKTGRRVRNQMPPIAPETVRRSKRTAAKAATAKNRVLTRQSAIRRPAPGVVEATPANAGRTRATRRDPGIAQMMATIRKQDNPMEALAEWKRELERMEAEIRGES